MITKNFKHLLISISLLIVIPITKTNCFNSEELANELVKYMSEKLQVQHVRLIVSDRSDLSSITSKIVAKIMYRFPTSLVNAHEFRDMPMTSLSIHDDPLHPIPASNAFNVVILETKDKDVLAELLRLFDCLHLGPGSRILAFLVNQERHGDQPREIIEHLWSVKDLQVVLIEIVNLRRKRTLLPAERDAVVKVHRFDPGKGGYSCGVDLKNRESLLFPVEEDWWEKAVSNKIEEMKLLDAFVMRNMFENDFDLAYLPIGSRDLVRSFNRNEEEEEVNNEEEEEEYFESQLVVFGNVVVFSIIMALLRNRL